mmetsp:Transcript_62249/g.100700  ORF Transcript_62249/g.100700 Transcript_62249/m.100700 type:complete len:90 (-) Transcript_62249:1234-1503(-)
MSASFRFLPTFHVRVHPFLLNTSLHLICCFHIFCEGEKRQRKKKAKKEEKATKGDEEERGGALYTALSRCTHVHEYVCLCAYVYTRTHI